MDEAGSHQRSFFELSEIFRRYLENRYDFPAQEWTTEEITSHFKNFSDLSERQKLQTRTLLVKIDKVKFAKAQTHDDPIDSVIQFIKEASPILVLPDQAGTAQLTSTIKLPKKS